MEWATLKDLNDYWDQKLRNIEKAQKLQYAYSDEDLIPAFKAIDGEMCKMQLLNAAIKTSTSKEREALKNLKDNFEVLDSLTAEIQHLIDNVPPHLPKKYQDKRKSDLPQASSEITESKTVLVVLNEGQAQSAKPGSSKTVNIYVPEIDYLTVEEFEKVPKYQRGRLKYDQINKLIDKMNISYKSKYQLLKQKKSTLNNANKRRVEAWTLQNIKETNGCYFITEEDIVSIGKATPGKELQSILAILRICLRIREVRGGKLTRYVYIDTY